MRKTKQEKSVNARTAYAILFGVGLVWALFFGGVLAYRMLLFWGAWPLFSQAYLWMLGRKVSSDQSLDRDTLDKGEACLYTLTLTNRARQLHAPKVYIRVRDFDGYQQRSAESMMSLSAGAKRTLHIGLRFRYRGVYHIGLDTLRLSDPLGLRGLCRREREGLSVTVYPRVLRLDSSFLPDIGFSQQEQNTRGPWEDRTEVKDLRAYQYGDALNRVHWKLSARKNQWITKLYENEESQERLFALDTRPPCDDKGHALETSDRMVEATVALIHHSLLRGLAARLVYMTPDGPAQLSFATTQALYRQMDVLAALAFDADQPLTTLLGAEYALWTRFASLTWITAQRSSESDEVLYKLAESKRPVSMVEVQPRPVGTELEIERPMEKDKKAVVFPAAVQRPEPENTPVPYDHEPVYIRVIGPDDELTDALCAETSSEEEVRA